MQVVNSTSLLRNDGSTKNPCKLKKQIALMSFFFVKLSYLLCVERTHAKLVFGLFVVDLVRHFSGIYLF